MNDQLLLTLAALSHECGGPDYVKGGGGNTSAKNETTIWVKPSGTTLAKMSPESFLAMDRAKLGRLYQTEMPSVAAAREAKVQELMAAAILPGQQGRPSVEAPLHDLLPGTFVIHNHPTLINGLTCAQRGAEACARLFPEALWIPYVDPGFSLCMDVRQRVKDYARIRGRQPTMLLLENHGIFVIGGSAEDIRAEYTSCFEKLRADYGKASLSTELSYGKAAPEAKLQEIRQSLREWIGSEAAFAAYSPAFAAARGPISPDHIVYAKSYPYEGPLTRDGLRAFRDLRGYAPQVLITPAGVLGVGSSQAKADLALALAQDGALVQQLAAAFGGIQFLSDAARGFIENWEVEVYRQKQIS
jgi:rhamnose utilization protein RhaD (predicted bifunctional aldolase and dehydrogenase)